MMMTSKKENQDKAGRHQVPHQSPLHKRGPHLITGYEGKKVEEERADMTKTAWGGLCAAVGWIPVLEG
jgi:hypothetical protein